MSYTDGTDRHGTTALLHALRAAGLDAGSDDGVPASSPEYRFDVEHTVGLLAQAIAAVHSSTATADAPPLDPDGLVERARAALEAGRLRPDRLSSAYRHIEPTRLVEVLAATRTTSLARPAPDPVLTHGRPTLDALRCRDGVALGFVGWERAALADPYRDLAVAATSVAEGLGPMLVPTFFDRYGEAIGDPARYSHPDPLRLDWYALACQLDP